MKIYFATKNKHKVEEVKAIMSEFKIDVEQLPYEKEEDKEKSIEEVAKINAEKLSAKTNLPIVVEDTGFYYHLYPNFPGSNPKLMFSLLGYKGLLKLLENEQNRGAEFRSALAYSDNKTTKIFVGKLTGTLSKTPDGMDLDVMPYERIFIKDNDNKKINENNKVIAFLPREGKNKISHRSDAFRQLAKWLLNNKTTN